MGKTKLIDLYILEILSRHADRQNKLSQNQILSYLENEYGVTVTRKTLSGYLNVLRAEKYIAGQRGIYKVNQFEDNELRLLIDGVLFGQHVPQKDAQDLIMKLKSLSGHSLRDRIKHVCYLEGMNHTPNEELYKVIDAIDEAIEKERKVQLTVCACGKDGKLYDRGERIVDPYYMVTAGNRYYLICYAGRDNDLENKRLDRIAHAVVLDQKRRPINSLAKYAQGFDLSIYMKEHIYMFSGDSVHSLLRIRRQNIGDFIDWYGMDFRIKEEDEEYITVRMNINENALYYWALQYGSVAEVLKPERLRERLRKGLAEMLDKYG